MLNLHVLPRSQQILLALGAVTIGTLLILAIAQFSSQVGTNLSAGTLIDEALEGNTLTPDGSLAEAPVTGAGGNAGSLSENNGPPPPPTIDTPPAGGVHIAYVESSDTLRYAINDGGPWRIETVATNAYFGAGLGSGNTSSMAIGTDGGTRTIHAAYITRVPSTIRYATKTGEGSWISTIIEAGLSPHPQGLSLALDERGRAHVVYSDAARDLLKYATNASGPWVVTVIDRGFRTLPSLVLDARGAAHVIYEGLGGLVYATNASGGWQSEVLEGTFAAGFSDIEVDNNGGVHIVYSFPYARELMYATKRSGTWSTEMIARSSWAGFSQHATLALDQGGRAHIAFLDADIQGNWIGYASNVSGSWVIRPATARDPSGSYSDFSIDVDQQGKSYISFIFGPRLGKAVWYTTNASGGWIPPTRLNSPGYMDEGNGTTIRVRATKLLSFR